MLTSLTDPPAVLLRRDAIAAGYDDAALHRAVRAGILVRLRQGAYAASAAWAEADAVQRHRLLSEAVHRLYDDTVALSHFSAHVAHGGPSWGIPLGDVHLTRLDGRTGRRQARVVHHHGACRVQDVARHQHGWVTSPTRTALDTASLLPREAAVVVLDWYLQQGLTSLGQLSRMMELMMNWPDHLHLQLALRLADPMAESVAESRFRLLCVAESLPAPESQYVIRDERGRFVARVDFAWPRHRVVVEVDGAEKYHRYRRPGETIEQMVMREKRREDRIREVTGWIVIRVTWADIERPAATVARIRRAFRAASPAAS